MKKSVNYAFIAVVVTTLRLSAQTTPIVPGTVDVSGNQIGRLTSVGNGGTRTFFQYDTLGRAVATEVVQDGIPRVMRTRYGYPRCPSSQSAGQCPSVPGFGTALVEQTFPDEEVVAYGYDNAGEQISIRSIPQNGTTEDVVRGIVRNARGQPTSTTLGNGAVTTYLYNADDLRLNRIKTTIAGTTIQDYLYEYDENGNITSIVDAVCTGIPPSACPNLSTTYVYDAHDQLTRISNSFGNPIEGYIYDAIGNLTQKGGLVQTYNAGGRPHALAMSDGVQYAYDANGNVTSIGNGGMTLDWNAENMSSRVTMGATVTTKAFIGESLWKKVENGVVTYYLPGIRYENGVPRKYYGSFAERSPEDGGLRYYHSDHLDSSSVMTDRDGSVIFRTAYLPYGADRGVDCDNPPCFIPKLLFNSKEKDATRLYHFGARIYSAETGRFLSADSDATDGLNRYAYAANNPIRFIDPTGHQIRPGPQRLPPRKPPQPPPPPSRQPRSGHRAPYGPFDGVDFPEPEIGPHEQTKETIFDHFGLGAIHLFHDAHHAAQKKAVQEYWTWRGFIFDTRTGKPVTNYTWFKFMPWDKTRGPSPCNPLNGDCGKTSIGNRNQENQWGKWNMVIPSYYALPADPNWRYYPSPEAYHNAKPLLRIKDGKFVYNF